MSVYVEQLAASAIREHLLLNLAAKVTEVNGQRAPVMKTALAGPFNVTAGMSLKVGTDGGAQTTVPLTIGAARTAAQVAAEVQAATSLTCAADLQQRWTITGTAPSSATRSVEIGEDTTGANALFGWAPGGEQVVRSQLVAPNAEGIADGWPLLNDLGGGFWVIIGDRESVPKAPHPRGDTYLVGLELAVFCPVTNEQAHKDREAIHSCIRCVRELLLTDAGLQAGRAASGDIMLITEKGARIPGRPWKFHGDDAPNVLFDVAAMHLTVRVFERPAAS